MNRSTPPRPDPGPPAPAEGTGVTRTAILTAATGQFRLYGLRKTSMEAIASAAGVAKATLYAYYPGKEAVFAAVSAFVAADLQARAEAAAAAAPDPAAAIRASLAAKFGGLREIVHASPHAHELLDASNALSGPALAEAHARYIDHLAALCARAGTPRREARPLAELLDACGEGIASRARAEAEVGAMVALLIRRVFSR